MLRQEDESHRTNVGLIDLRLYIVVGSESCSRWMSASGEADCMQQSRIARQQEPVTTFLCLAS